MALTAWASDQETLGFFRIFATPPGGIQREITLFRGAPVTINSVSTQDPFTEVTAQIALPQVTVFDNPGEGDLEWLVHDCDIDIRWENMGSYDLVWSWEGYIASYSFDLSGSTSGFTIDLKGAFYGLDDYLAIPTFPRRPIPYEILIGQAFDQARHPAHLSKFSILWPSDWSMRVPPFNDPNYLIALKPWGVSTDQLWTGFMSRNTGSWEPLLTGHVQGLLAVMFAEGGSQWSIRNLGHRRPQLFLRKIPDSRDDRIIEIQLGAPGVQFNGTRDFTQRAGVIYGSGKDEAGVEFSNIQVSPDGKTTYYKPYAYSSRMYPRQRNPIYDPRIKPKETLIRFQDGIDEVAAMKVAQGQYHRFSEPGITGSITLTTDPRLSSGQLMPRLMIRGGQSLRINGLFGIRDGVLAHITQVSADFNALTTQLTFDTKYRDQLTVEEVRARTRDALNPLHALQLGKYSNTIQDLILPWSYKAGSGVIPQGATKFYNDILPANAEFPYETWTRQHPPSHPKSAGFYIKIGPTDKKNSNANWSCVTRDGQPLMAIPIRMSQAGSIRLTQLAAYDKDGNVMRVKFHASFYTVDGVAVNSMPQFPGQEDPNFPAYLKARKPGVAGVLDKNRPLVGVNYGNRTNSAGLAQGNPFYMGAWEKVRPDGTLFPWGGNIQLADPSFIVGWGNYYEPAGYSPGKFTVGRDRTGLLIDNAAWSWDLSEDLDMNKPRMNRKEEYAGIIFVMIYCDDQDDQPVYFMGKLIRVEPGTS